LFLFERHEKENRIFGARVIIVKDLAFLMKWSFNSTDFQKGDSIEKFSGIFVKKNFSKFFSLEKIPKKWKEN